MLQIPFLCKHLLKLPILSRLSQTRSTLNHWILHKKLPGPKRRPTIQKWEQPLVLMHKQANVSCPTSSAHVAVRSDDAEADPLSHPLFRNPINARCVAVSKNVIQNHGCHVRSHNGLACEPRERRSGHSYFRVQQLQRTWRCVSIRACNPP
jgi:hypothetical protein